MREVAHFPERPARWFPTACGAGFFLLMLALAAPGPVAGQSEIFERGNQLYQDGDYPGAIEAYRAVGSAGFEGPDLHYNLGNAHFKAGHLGRAILEWERALSLAPNNADAAANLALARSLTVDAVEPLPRFWLLQAASWWVELLPRGVLILLVALAWLTTAGGGVIRILTRRADLRVVGSWLLIFGGIGVLVLGTNLVVRDFGIGRAEIGIILVTEAPVRSAPAEEDDLVLFRVHEGTKVRIDGRSGEWAEVVLEDGKVGWVRGDVLESLEGG